MLVLNTHMSGYKIFRDVVLWWTLTLLRGNRWVHFVPGLRYGVLRGNKKPSVSTNFIQGFSLVKSFVLNLGYLTVALYCFWLHKVSLSTFDTPHSILPHCSQSVLTIVLFRWTILFFGDTTWISLSRGIVFVRTSARFAKEYVIFRFAKDYVIFRGKFPPWSLRHVHEVATSCALAFVRLSFLDVDTWLTKRTVKEKIDQLVTPWMTSLRSTKTLLSSYISLNV